MSLKIKGLVMQTSLLLEEFRCPPEESNTGCALSKM